MMPRGSAHGTTRPGVALGKDPAPLPLPTCQCSSQAEQPPTLGAHPSLLPVGEPRSSLLLLPFPCGHQTERAAHNQRCCSTSRKGPSAWTPGFPVPSLWLDDPGEGSRAMPRCAMLCRSLPGWSSGPALPRLCQAVAAQVTGLSRAAAGCELPAKRAVGTSTTPHCPSQCWHCQAPHTSCRRAGVGCSGALPALLPSISIHPHSSHRCHGDSQGPCPAGVRYPQHPPYRVPCTQGVPTHRAGSAASPCRRGHAGNAGSLGMPRRL